MTMTLFAHCRQCKRLAVELSIVFALGICVYILSARYDLMETMVAFSRLHENWELDEFLSVSLYSVLAFTYFAVRRWKELATSEKDLLRLNQELRKSLSEIKQLRGILPICANCKKIRDDEGYWRQIEAYVHEHANVEFSHSICPDCMKKLYSDYMDAEKEKDERG